MNKRSKRILKFTLYTVLLALIIIPVATAVKSSAASWTQVNACYITNAATEIKQSQNASSATLGTVPAEAYIYVICINGQWGKTAYNGVTGYVNLASCTRKATMPETSGEVIQRLEAIKMYYSQGDRWLGSTEDSSTGGYRNSAGKLDGSGTCFGFAREVWRAIFGTEMTSWISSKRYELANVGSFKMKMVGQVTGNYTVENVKNLLMKASPGDIIQLGNPHTMIVDHVEADGIYIYDANSIGYNIVRESGYFTWQQFYNERRNGISLYTHQNYPTSTVPNILAGAITVKNASNVAASQFYIGDTIKFSANIGHATSVTYYIAEKNSGAIVAQFTSDQTSGSYVFSELKNGSNDYCIYYTATNSAFSKTSDKVNIKVISPSVTISNGEVNIYKAQTLQISATKIPVGATLAWTSNNINVATVNANGVVSANEVGTAVITVTLTYKGTSGAVIRREASVTVTVKNQIFTAYFDAMGGNASASSIKVENSMSYGWLFGIPAASREGYIFDGWFTAKTGGTKVDNNTPVNLKADVTLYAHWTPIKYNLTFVTTYEPDSLGNVTVLDTLSKEVTYDQKYGALPTPQWTGHTFEGWFTAENDGVKVDANSVVKITADTILYAHWTISTYKITFDTVGGSAEYTEKYVQYIELYGEFPAVSRRGYTFVGWFTDAKNGTQMLPDMQVVITNNITLYAHWTANSYDIKFEPAGGTVSQTDKTVVYDDVYGALPIPKRKGYAFTGWYTAEKGGTRILASSIVSVTDTQILYAQWEPGSYIISFNANGGVTGTDSKPVVYLTTYGSLPVPEKVGYTFTGWFTGADGGDEILPDTPVDITENQTLYAHWSVNTYVVSFDSQSVECEFDSKEITFDTPYGELPVPTKLGYTFDGWHTAQENGDKITELSLLKIGENSTLYAIWIPNKYIVTFNVNGGNGGNEKKEVDYELPYGELPIAEKTGYIFEGWYMDDMLGEHITQASLVQYAYDITVYAHWSPKKINLTFDANGGDATFGGKTVVFDDKYFELPVADRVGYAFVAWKLSDGTSITANSTVKASDDCTVKAEWKALEYTVSFDTAGGIYGTDDAQLIMKVTYDSEYPELVTPKRYGYRFIGWKTLDGNHAYTGDIVKITSAQAFIAEWASLRISVTFDTMGGELDITSTEVVFDSKYDALPLPERYGYTFIGWQNKLGEIIVADSIVTDADNHVLTAKWEPIKHTVVFETGDDSITAADMTVVYDAVYGSLPEVERAGYKFIAWHNANGEAVTSDDAVTGVDDEVFTAQWTPLSYEITFDGSGSTYVVPPMVVIYDSEYKNLPNAEKEGYKFIGWYYQGEKIENGSTVSITSNVTFTAKWEAIVYKIIFEHNGGVCDVDSAEFTCDKLHIDMPNISRMGYNFLGWFDPDGNVINEGTTVVIHDELVLTAQWEAIKYNVFFSVNGTVDTSLTMRIQYNKPYEFLPEIAADGYKFKGWLDKDGNSVENDDIYTAVSDTTLYADINMNSFNVTFFADGGKPQYSHMKVYFGDEFGEMPETVKAGYLFEGWFTEDGIQITGDTVVDFTEDTTLYAHWAKIEANTTEVLDGNDMLVTGCELLVLSNLLILGLTTIRKKNKK